MTTAILLVLLGSLSRLLPHPPNFVAMGALALYSGARLPRRWAYVVPLGAMALSDVALDWATGRSVFTLLRAAVYGSFAAIVLVGRFALAGRPARPLRLASLSVGGSVLFYFVTNFANWLEFDTYPATAAGLALCYAAAIPWFWNTLAADLLGTAALFGLDALSVRQRRSAAMAALFFATVVGVASAQEVVSPPPTPAPAPTPAPVAEQVVVTATAAPSEESSVGAATTVITREEIERRGYRRVTDVLRGVPGLDVAQSGADGALTSVFMRGANSTGALLLVDGVRMNSESFGGYDFSMLTTENVERIEIVRGPFSALYGSDALGGVIQIFTRSGSGTHGLSGRASGEAGNAGRGEGEVSAAYGEGAIGVSASGRAATVDNDRPNSDWKQWSGAARLDWAPAEHARLGLEASILDGESGVPGPVGAETPHSRSTWREERFALPASFRPAEGHDATVIVDTVRSTPTFSNPDFGYTDRTTVRSYQGRAADTWTSGPSRLTGFVSYDRGEVDDVDTFGTNLDGSHTTLWGVGAEETLKLGRGWLLTAGLRYDNHSQFGDAWSPRASLVWNSADALWKVRAAGGSAFRAPTVGELYYPFSGNADLKPERSRSWEVGAERTTGGGSGRVEVTLFWNEFRDLIVFDFASFQDKNIQNARTRGVEVAFRQDLTAAVSVDVGYTWLDAQDLTAGTDLIRRPRHRAYLSLVLQPLDGLTISPRATFVGERLDNSATTSEPVENPSYVRYDLFVRYALVNLGAGRLAPYARVENATDKRYEEVAGYPASRRRVTGGLEVAF
jgi:vitamin B12 transporter